MVKNVKAKRGFVGATKKKSRKRGPKATKAQMPKDPVDSLTISFQQSAGLEVKKAISKKKRSAKTNRSVVRKQRKVRIAGTKRKNKRKGIN